MCQGQASRGGSLPLAGGGYRQWLGRWAEKGQGAGQFNLPHGICFDSRGAVYVAEITGKRLQKFTAR